VLVGLDPDAVLIPQPLELLAAVAETILVLGVRSHRCHPLLRLAERVDLRDSENGRSQSLEGGQLGEKRVRSWYQAGYHFILLAHLSAKSTVAQPM